MKKVARKGHYIFGKYRRNPKTGEIVCASAYGKKRSKFGLKIKAVL